MKRFFLFFLFSVFVSSVFAAEGRSIAVLLDVSRSMPPEDFAKAKQLIQSLVDSTSAPDTVSIYAFGTDVKKIDSADLPSVQASESYTMLYDAAYDAARELATLPATRKAMVILSDGDDTKSVTILEDIVSFVNQQKIAVYGVGAGKADRKVLERMAKLTGGRYFEISHPTLLDTLEKDVASQEAVTAKAEPVGEPASSSQVSQGRPVQPVPAEPQPAPGESQQTPQEPEQKLPWMWIGIIGAAVIALALGAVLIVRSARETRVCPTCGKALESYQTICPECSGADTKQSPTPARVKAPSDGTQEIKVEEEPDLIPIEWLEKKPVTEEMLSKTFVLMETPMLVVRKGKNLGQTYSLNRAFPVSIGRSRVNEIRLEDISVSAQHCRIIPENGRHVLYDLGSTNGTFINDSRVNKATPLKEGDSIKIGETQFLYKVEQFRT